MQQIFHIWLRKFNILQSRYIVVKYIIFGMCNVIFTYKYMYDTYINIELMMGHIEEKNTENVIRC